MTAPASTNPTGHPSGRILIADDEVTFGEGLADALRREGYICQTVTDGRAVAAELHTNPQYDVLITDIRMPGNPDRQLVPHVAQIAEGLPVILVTAFPDPASAIKSAEVPVIAYLAKPVQFPELLAHVKRGVAYSAVFRAGKAIEQRLTHWGGKLHSFQELLSKRTSLAASTPDEFVRDSMTEMIACIEDLIAMWQSVSNQPAPAKSDALAESLQAALQACRNAIHK